MFASHSTDSYKDRLVSESVLHTTALDLFFAIAASAVINSPSASSGANRASALMMPSVALRWSRWRARGFKLDTDPTIDPRPDATREDGVPSPLKERDSCRLEYFCAAVTLPSPSPQGRINCLGRGRYFVGVVARCVTPRHN